ncbi:hypothetical protein CSB93_1125 [Pseudomonas paraeruginosa]|uniref:Uncharacterized protein n=1 Tax=Pseudomonas paraeruginosa TaxID=2994495 RepID=A0A2R3IWR5_9PSED|nr:hypothetical protein CSB93_1125 [Pseudomonas paraeruginosa]AWE90091.1 hypothetical protein CSC28_6441 [Pseudomonas paraeruginosa]
MLLELERLSNGIFPKEMYEITYLLHFPTRASTKPAFCGSPARRYCRRISLSVR